jgi:hypothetical protein
MNSSDAPAIQAPSNVSVFRQTFADLSVLNGM